MDFEEAKRILAALEREDTARPQDRLDAEAIRERFGLEEND